MRVLDVFDLAGKRLRYAAEFFAPLFPAGRSRGYVAALMAVQDVLGLGDEAQMNHPGEVGPQN